MLRTASAADVPSMQHVRRAVRENRLVSTSISDNDVRVAIEETGRGWVIDLDGEVVAFAIGNASTGNIWALFVHPGHERRGYGRALHDVMVDWLWSTGLTRLWLTTESGTRAVHFYEAAGWQLVGPADHNELRYERYTPTSPRGCASAERGGDEFPPPTKERFMSNVALLQGLYDAFGRGDIPAVLAAMSSDIKWYQAEGNPYNPSGEAWVGPDTVLNNLFMRLGSEWDGFNVHVKRFLGAGDTVIVEGRYTGTYKPTGKRMDAQVCHVWDVKGGKITRFQQYMDTAQVQAVFSSR